MFSYNRVWVKINFSETWVDECWDGWLSEEILVQNCFTFLILSPLLRYLSAAVYVSSELIFCRNSVMAWTSPTKKFRPGHSVRGWSNGSGFSGCSLSIRRNTTSSSRNYVVCLAQHTDQQRMLHFTLSTVNWRI